MRNKKKIVLKLLKDVCLDFIDKDCIPLSDNRFAAKLLYFLLTSDFILCQLTTVYLWENMGLRMEFPSIECSVFPFSLCLLSLSKVIPLPEVLSWVIRIPNFLCCCGLRNSFAILAMVTNSGWHWHWWKQIFHEWTGGSGKETCGDSCNFSPLQISSVNGVL